MLRITRPAGGPRTEVLGGAVLAFDPAGVARVDGLLRPAVEAAINARGYRIDLELEVRHDLDDVAAEFGVDLEPAGDLGTGELVDPVDVDELPPAVTFPGALPPVPSPLAAPVL